MSVYYQWQNLRKNPAASSDRHWTSMITSEMHMAWYDFSWSKQVDWGAGVERMVQLQFSWVKQKTALTGAAKQPHLPLTDKTSWWEGSQVDVSKKEKTRRNFKFKTGSQTEGTSAVWAIASWNSLAGSHHKHIQFDEGCSKITNKNITLSNGLCH